MYRLLIAEDEPLEREGLLNAVERLSPEIGEIRVAENGRQAVELAEEFGPDLAILDIKMPGIDGIEAARRLRQRNPELQVIFLTAFDQFEYARQALRLQAAEFLVKPAADEEVADALRKAAHTLGERREADASQEELSRTVELLTPLAERQLIEKLLLGDEKSLESVAALLGSRREAALLVLRLTPSAAEQLSPVPGRREARLRRLQSAIHSITRRGGYEILPYSRGSELRIALFPGEGASNDGEIFDAMEKGIAEYARQEGVTVRGIITEASSRASVLARWATEASIILERNDSQEALLSHLSEDRPLGDDHYALERALLGVLRRGDGEEVRRVGEELLSTAESPRMLAERLTYLAHALRVPAIAIGEEFGQGRERELFLRGLEELRRRYQERGFEELSPPVRRVKEHIDHHYMEDLTLESLAKVASLSAYHLSRLFRKESGRTVVGYITERRLSVARDLLSEGTLSVKEVSARAGFADASYFGRVFARAEGVSPGEYRRERITP